jgi:hypothetical protein
MNQKLEAISDKAAADLQAYIKEHEDKILEAWNNAEQEAQDNEATPKFKLGFGISLDLDKDTMETALTWGIKFKASRTTQIPDTNQVALPLDGEGDTDGFTAKVDKIITDAAAKVGAKVHRNVRL